MVWKVANHKVFVLPALLYKIVHSDFFPFPMYVWEGYGDLILGTGLVTGTQSHTCRPLCLADSSGFPGLLSGFFSSTVSYSVCSVKFFFRSLSIPFPVLLNDQFHHSGFKCFLFFGF